MHGTVAAHLTAWESFYIIVASSAGALTGLQFVVMALIAEVEKKSSRHEVSAFGTPTVMHFCAVLLTGAVLSTPWGSLRDVAIALGAAGLAGVIYTLIVIKRARRQTGYHPDVGDWMWHAVAPLSAYLALVLSAITLPRTPDAALFVVGGAALALLFTGIHNSWDTVTYIAVGPGRPKQQGARPAHHLITPPEGDNPPRVP